MDLDEFSEWAHSATPEELAEWEASLPVERPNPTVITGGQGRGWEWWHARTRDACIAATGSALVVNELLVRSSARPLGIAVGAAVIGVPLALRLDGRS